MVNLFKMVVHGPADRWSRRRSGRKYGFAYDHVLGTSCDSRIWARSSHAAGQAQAAILSEVDRLAPILSGWSDISELSVWQRTYGVDVSVSHDLAEVLELAETWRRRTAGAFEPAAPAAGLTVVSGNVEAEGHMDAAPAREQRRLQEPLWELDRSREVARRVTHLPMSLDAIAKGYIIDRAVDRARKVPGVRSILLNIGGDVRHHGQDWANIGVTNPFAPADNAPSLAVATIQSEGLATSGCYRRGVQSGGRFLSHIVDPWTGESVTRVVSASVIAPDCTTADALSTAFSVLTPSQSVALADSLLGIACLIVDADGTITTNSRWVDRAIPSGVTANRSSRPTPRNRTDP